MAGEKREWGEKKRSWKINMLRLDDYIKKTEKQIITYRDKIIELEHSIREHQLILGLLRPKLKELEELL